MTRPPQQLSVFAEPRARHDNPPTSSAAARSIAERHGPLEAKIKAAFRHAGPMPDFELVQIVADEYPPTVVTARSRLTRAGAIVPTDNTRISPRGRAAIVWDLAP